LEELLIFKKIAEMGRKKEQRDAMTVIQRTVTVALQPAK
jgi:hypothetical protein